MPITLFPKWSAAALFIAAFLLTGCGITTKKTFLDEPVQPGTGSNIPITQNGQEQVSQDTLAKNPALNSAEATGVQKLLSIITPYRIDIQQGNFISQEMLTKIQPGMTKEQVRFALGTPLLTDVFHARRWDYIFRLQKTSGKVTNNRVVIYFGSDNRVARIIHDPLPDETQYLEAIAGPVVKKKGDERAGKGAAPPGKAASTDKPTGMPEEKKPSSDSPKPVTETATPASPDSAQTAPVTMESVEVAPAGETGHVKPAVTEAAESAPTGREATRPRSVQRETGREKPVETDSGKTVRPTTQPAEPRPVQKETRRPPETDRHEREPVPVKRPETRPATVAEPARAATPPPAGQDVRKKAATTTQDISDDPGEDFRAAPHSTMQLHELMQPQ